MFVKDTVIKCNYCNETADWTNKEYPKRKGVFFNKETYWLTPIGKTVFYCDNCFKEKRGNSDRGK